MNKNMQRQRGLSLFSMLFIIAFLIVVALISMKVFPTYIEYKAIQAAIEKAKTGTTVDEVRKSFTSSAMVQDIDSIAAKDLEIIREESSFIVKFSYAKKIPLMGPVSLLIDYAGSTN